MVHEYYESCSQYIEVSDLSWYMQCFRWQVCRADATGCVDPIGRSVTVAQQLHPRPCWSVRQSLSGLVAGGTHPSRNSVLERLTPSPSISLSRHTGYDTQITLSQLRSIDTLPPVG